ncbi:MAG: hypothetical protein GY835_05350 [bacterium]|nr:hypothetical protein [bacterium]
MNRPSGLIVCLALLLLISISAQAHQDKTAGSTQALGMDAAMLLDGSFVHNVGELQMNITNFGVFGSYPTWGLPMSESPSAQWPAGSGVEYLWSAGIWCGALVSGVPRVSTTQAGVWEFRPGLEPIYTVYRSFEGARGGTRLPSPAVDDDNDNMIDEDPLDGFDNDGDGEIDEDFSAISNQMFRTTYRDDLPECFSSSSDHQPLNVFIVQESYQWENDRVDDFVGVEFWITNIGEATLENFCLGFYADPDVGSRTLPNNYEDDLVDVISQTACVKKGNFNIPVTFAMGVAYDEDGDLDADEPALGEIGIMFMGHTTDPGGETAPARVGLRSWQAFSGSASFEDGGDPTNDNQRYELLADDSNDKKPTAARDYRMLLSAGPFLVSAGETINFQVAFVIGEGRDGLLDNAAQAKLTYDGNWFNLDGDIATPDEDCAETLIFDPLNDVEWANPCDSLSQPMVVTKGDKAWVNNDCLFELEANELCAPGATEGSDSWWCTGRGEAYGGLETQIHWLYGSAPPAPNLRIWPTEGKNVLFWDNFSESIPDVSELVYDFEGYRIWRADNWARPYGSSVDNGPSTDLWMLLNEYDLPNGLGSDSGLDIVRYMPNIDANLVAFYTDTLMINSGIEDSNDLLPPRGYTMADADTAIAIAKQQLGLPGGRSYYRYEDTRVHTGMHYFYSVTAMDHITISDPGGNVLGYGTGLSGDPSSGFVYTVPQSRSQGSWEYDPSKVIVVPNPATTESMAPWALGANNDDPTGLKIEFRHLPAGVCTIRIFSLAGDLVESIEHDLTDQINDGDYASTGTVAWDLVSRNGQDVASGVYIYAVEADGFETAIGKFVVIR